MKKEERCREDLLEVINSILPQVELNTVIHFKCKPSDTIANK